MKPFYRIVKTVAWPIARLIFWFKPIDKNNIPKEGGLILCCNHTSYLDIAFLVLTCKRPIRFMAKEELFKGRFMAWFYRNMGGFPIKRGAGDTAAIDTAKEIVSSGGILGVFPEGTRTREPDGRPGRGKSGAVLIAAATGADVVPVGINYGGKVGPFRRISVRYGEPIKNSEIALSEESRGELRRVTTMIMGRITALWEKGSRA